MKYPNQFDDAVYGLVLGAYAADGYAWHRWCKISRRQPGKITIEGDSGCTWTFTIQDAGAREHGYITQYSTFHPSRCPRVFEVIPFNK